MKAITPRQMDILRFVKQYRTKFGYSPTMQEIGDALDLSKVTVFEHVGALEKKALVIRGDRHKARSLQLSDEVVLPEEQQRPTRIPLAGRIAAGSPIEAIEQNESVDLEELFSGERKTFCLKVAGDSMIDEQIRDGDYVICEERSDARNGETVVALLDSGEATLKKFYREKGRIRLQPANAAYAPIIVDNVRIQGVVVGVIRKL